MPPPPKLTPEQWADIRVTWEADTRGGFAWIVNELSLPVSLPAVRKMALKPSSPWVKNDKKHEIATKETNKSTPQKNPEKPTEKTITSQATDGFEDDHQQAGGVSTGAASMVSDIIDGDDETQETIDCVHGSAHSTPCFDALPLKKKIFVREYVSSMHASQSAARAGYSLKSAAAIASRLLKSINIKKAIAELNAARFEKLDIDADELLKKWHETFTADHNELTQYRRVCCRCCWGKGHAYQYTPNEFGRASIAHESKRARVIKDGGKDIGDFPGIDGDWYDKRKEINPDCPECFGDGVGEAHINDTRRLNGKARTIYAGIKETKDGIEVKTLSAEKAGELLGRAIQVFQEGTNVNVNVGVVSAESLTDKYKDLMSKARAKQRSAMESRGITIDQDDG